MQKTRSLLILSCCLLFSSSVYAERVALLIGNSAYGVRALRNPSNDVNKMAQKLRSLGFTSITAKKNLNKPQMKQVIRQFSQRLKAGDEALFYYSGHGAQAGNLNYLIPIRTDIQSEDEVADEAIPLRFILNKLRNTRAKLNLVILDACRNNPYNSRDKGMKKGLGRITQQISQSTLVAFSASFNQTSDDGNRGNGLYTQYLLKHLATPNITLNTMFNKVRNDVYKASKGKQHPKEENGLLQDVYLNKAGKVVEQNRIRQQQAQQRTKQEQIRQQQIKAQQEKARQQRLRQQGKSATKTSGRRIGQYIDHGNGTVTDDNTKLMWKKCSEGQVGNNCSGKAKTYTWDGAVKRFRRVSFAGRNDWRLPTIKELRTLVYCANGTPQNQSWDKGCNKNYTRTSDDKPAIRNNVFPNTVYKRYWSSLPVAGFGNALAVNFDNGNESRGYKHDNLQVRLVRSGQ